ncbi:M23 family metallopeptidase [Nocardia arthritidis]|uniref:Peptidoglycan DD-metalloendopeptidase family protein n=1 Tax=Nocardia arthritidis TaxID=228602 RepID=A0A6G9Y704_9NOCA|nr:M23 family metallopeptidase [Nocardia arthritidis]QIS08856.1 peptidoglycan DD-metalloendopeptidase family protein [Nocardia arthritidis]
MSLVGEGVSVRPKRHRAEPATSDRVKVAAGVAVATGALIGTATQLLPAVASATPMLPGSHHHGDQSGSIKLQTKTEPVAETTQVATPVADAAPAPEAPAPAPAAPVAAPFGLQNLPPEVAGPLAQAEQVIKGLQQQVTPAPPQQAVRPVGGEISSGFGSRWGEFHYGLDFADQLGAPIHSVSSGTVIDAGPASGFGLWVRVKQDDGTTAVYGHVNEFYVHPGQRVNTGDVIATVGNRGNSTGPHLHLEIWDPSGTKIDPYPWLAAKGVPMQWGPTPH